MAKDAMEARRAAFWAVTTRWVDAWNEANLEGMLREYADDVVYFTRLSDPPVLRGKAALRAFLTPYMAAPQPRLELLEVLIGVRGLALVLRRADGMLAVYVGALNAEGRIKRAALYHSTRRSGAGHEA